MRASTVPDHTAAGARRYRSKAQRPCDLCRARKALCNIPDPLQPCQLCRRIGRECTFVGSPGRRQRGRRGGSASRLSAPAVSGGVMPGVLDMSIDTVDLTAARDGIVQGQHDTPEFVWTDDGPLNWDLANEQLGLEFQDSPSAFLQPNDTPEPQPAINIPSASPSSPPPPREQHSLDQRSNHSTTFIGHSNESDPFLVNRFPRNDRDEIDFFRVTYRKVSSNPPLHFLQSQAGTAVESRRVVNDCLPAVDDRAKLEALIDQTAGAALVRLSLPILSRSQILPSVSTFVATAPTGLLAGIYALALPFTPWDDALCLDSAYAKPDAEKLWRIAHVAHQRELPFPSLSTVQTALLLLNRPAPDAVSVENPSAWSAAASVLAVAQELGLNVDPKGWEGLPGWEVRLRRRLWWAVFVEHGWRAVTHGRASMVRHDDWDVAPLDEGDFVVDEGFSSLTSFASTLRAVSKKQTVEALISQAGGPRQQLLDWLEHLPQSLRLRPEETSSPGRSIEGHAPLHVAYYTAHILIFRALLRPIVSEDDLLPSPASTGPVLQASRGLAQAATRFVRGLGARHQSAFWPAWTRHCLSYPGLFCYMLGLQRAEPGAMEEDRRLLDEWREALRTRVSSWPLLRFGIVKVDAIYWKGLREAAT
ncbi:fungal specific transcription factor domain-containing protein [Colletotrichum sojae]|uniref:Fungal specific transcription factor domain-containing protein n=1 Tax=Colletotrichum sojae TaxID=2175907 RepID=A0A8H6ML06_9PEZI|nr:fungal specific transcription factor domain-containing protein [Colletotrichum sojae]